MEEKPKKKDASEWIHLRIPKPLKANFKTAASLEERKPCDMLRILIKRFVAKKLQLESVK